ncbi:SDR family oxidoreductase [Cytophagaceae bacterium ABcell3]|nr:SDR family oxidoreductase [Cytophagaceae bacterium ABcell3]
MYERKYHRKDISKYSFLITGGAGFIGANLVEYLLKYGAGKVVVLDDLSTGNYVNIEAFAQYGNFQFIEGDIRSQNACNKACEGIDIILHQAALGSVPRSVKDPVTTNEVNVTGFLNMLNAAKENGIKRFVYAASSSVYGDHPGLPKVEAHIGKPLSPYAVSKYVNELYANVFSGLYGIETIGLRYFNIFGPKQSPEGSYAAVIPLFINKMLNHAAPEINGDGLQSRDFTFVENAVQANVLAALTDNNEAVNQVYNIAVGEQTSLNGLVRLIGEVSGITIQPEYKSPRPGDIKDSLADIGKAQQFLDYKPYFNVKDGLSITFEWFKKNFEHLNQN